MSAGAGAAPKRCFYDILQVECTATDDEIKKAFRKIALVWHPDKNLHRLEEATERFKEIQAAYAVLSDENERAWYDRHKESVLGGGDVDSNLINLYQYFSSSAYTGFDDSKTGFYTIFSDVFDKIIAEEKRYAESSDSEVPPSFGNSSTSAEAVIGFYRFWSAYTSRMHFAWSDEHNPLEAPNRYIRRAMEKENKAIRSKAKKERTEDIRALVGFCKRLDKRYIAATMELKRAEEERQLKMKQAAAERTRAAAAERQRIAEAYAAASEAYHRELAETRAFRLAEADEEEEKEKRKKKRTAAQEGVVKIIRQDPLLDAVDADSQGDSSSDTSEEELLVCELCNKTFRTFGALQSHEKSKKHLAVMKELGITALSSVSGGADAGDRTSPVAPDTEAEPATRSDAEGDQGSDAQTSGNSSVDDAEEIPLEELLAEDGGHARRRSTSSSSSKDSASGSDSDNLATLLASISVKKRSAVQKTAQAEKTIVPVAAAESSDDEPRKRKIKRKLPGKADELQEDGVGSGPAEVKTEVAKPKKARRAKGKEKEKPALAPAEPADDAPAFRVEVDKDFLTGGSKGKPLRAMFHEGEEADILGTSKCEICGDAFETRNKLFQHIKKTGHATLKDAPATKGKGKRR